MYIYVHGAQVQILGLGVRSTEPQGDSCHLHPSRSIQMTNESFIGIEGDLRSVLIVGISRQLFRAWLNHTQAQLHCDSVHTFREGRVQSFFVDRAVSAIRTT